MPNPTNPQGGPARNPSDKNEKTPYGAEQSGRSDPSRSSSEQSRPGSEQGRSGSEQSGRPDSSRSSQGSGEQGDLRDAIRELAQSIECLCGDASKRDEPGARRHADQARRMAGQRGASSASRREPDDRDSERIS